MDSENTMAKHYYSVNFNSYTAGPGSRMSLQRLPGSKQDNRVQDPLKLYVAGIRLDMTESGLRSYLAMIGCPEPSNLRIFRGKFGSTPCNQQCAFLTYENTRNASEALLLLNKKEPYYFRVNFAIKAGERERLKKEAEGEIKVRNVGSDFHDYVTSRRSQNVNLWQQCTTFNDDVDSSPSLEQSSSLNGIVAKERPTQHKPSNGHVDCSLQDLVNAGLIRFLKSTSDVCEYCSISPYTDHVHYVIDEAAVINPLQDLPNVSDIFCCFCKSLPKSSFQVCITCKSAIYCSKWCQINDWSQHRTKCGTV